MSIFNAKNELELLWKLHEKLTAFEAAKHGWQTATYKSDHLPGVLAAEEELDEILAELRPIAEKRRKG